MLNQLVLTPIAVGVADGELPTTFDGSYKTAALNVERFRELVVYLDVTYDGLTSVELLLEASHDGGTTFGPCQNDNGGTAADVVISRALNASQVLAFRLNVTGLHWARLQLKRTDGSSADTVALSWSGNNG